MSSSVIDRSIVERMVRQALTQSASGSATTNGSRSPSAATQAVTRSVVEQMVRQALTRQLQQSGQSPAVGRGSPRLVVNISARHCHVTHQDQ